MSNVFIKSVYERPSQADGFRVLVERKWPSAIGRTSLAVDLWAKDLGPSTGLRKWLGADPKRWSEFRQRYEWELLSPAAQGQVREIFDAAGNATAITLLYSADDAVHNQAVILKDALDRVQWRARERRA